MASVREWLFKRKFRTNAYGWRASSLAIGRLKEAAAEIRSVAKSDPVAAGDGVVSLMERIWPSFQGIDTSRSRRAARLGTYRLQRRLRLARRVARKRLSAATKPARRVPRRRLACVLEQILR